MKLVGKKMVDTLWKGTVNGVVPRKEKDFPVAVETEMAELFKKFPVPVK